MPFGFGGPPRVPMSELRNRANAKHCRELAEQFLQLAIDTGDEAHFEHALVLEADAAAYEHAGDRRR